MPAQTKKAAIDDAQAIAAKGGTRPAAAPMSAAQKSAGKLAKIVCGMLSSTSNPSKTKSKV